MGGKCLLLERVNIWYSKKKGHFVYLGTFLQELRGLRLRFSLGHFERSHRLSQCFHHPLGIVSFLLQNFQGPRALTVVKAVGAPRLPR